MAIPPKDLRIDAIDHRILDVLQQDAGLTNQALADRVGLSPSACHARVKRLRGSGLIERVVALLDPEAIGACPYVIVEVTMERDDKALYRRFERRVLEATEIKQCYQVTGECDFMLIVSVPDMDAYDRFCDRVLYAEPNLRRFRPLLSRHRVKFDLSTSLAASP